ncbi:MAG: iron ABC transporter permease [Bacteroidales bacterium]|nr:iron ABC transporter permease [Bacteroidales bacterium]
MLFLLLIVVIISFILDLFLGSVSIKPSEIVQALFRPSGDHADIILFKFRLPKAITALFVGISLSISGLQMQTLFRNPMAGPYVLGLSSGSSLGVALVILGFSAGISPDAISGLGNWSMAIAAWVGAGLIMMLMMIIASKVDNILTVLIIGIMLSSGISAAVSIMQYFSNETMLKAYIVWTMGSLGNLTSTQLSVLLISVTIGVSLSVISVKPLNALLTGENYARTLGMNLKLSRFVIITSTSILTGTVTAFCGPIGFIGLAVPHLARILFMTSDHRILIPGTILTGGTVMLLSDIISQMPWSDNIIPVNSITALIGIPVVIWVIMHNRKYSEIF